jgi:hypothetical protein
MFIRILNHQRCPGFKDKTSQPLRGFHPHLSDGIAKQAFCRHQDQLALFIIVEIEGTGVRMHLVFYEGHDVVHRFPEIAGLSDEHGDPLKESYLIARGNHFICSSRKEYR